MRRGDCSLTTKSKHAFRSNATALIVQNTDDEIFNFGLEYELEMVPVVTVTKSTGDKVISYRNFTTIQFETPLRIFRNDQGYAASDFSSVCLSSVL